MSEHNTGPAGAFQYVLLGSTASRLGEMRLRLPTGQVRTSFTRSPTRQRPLSLHR
jgi:hypothetical protein